MIPLINRDKDKLTFWGGPPVVSPYCICMLLDAVNPWHTIVLEKRASCDQDFPGSSLHLHITIFCSSFTSALLLWGLRSHHSKLFISHTSYCNPFYVS